MAAVSNLVDWLIHALGGHTQAELHRHGAECVAIGRFEAHREAFERAMAMNLELQRIRADLDQLDQDEPDHDSPRASLH